MSATPRTDAATAYRPITLKDGTTTRDIFVSRDHACTLERELAAMTVERDALQDVVDLQTARIRILELESSETEVESTGDRVCQESDGCPTENAVLRREWRLLTARCKALQAECDGLMKQRNDTIHKLTTANNRKAALQAVVDELVECQARSDADEFVREHEGWVERTEAAWAAARRRAPDNRPPARRTGSGDDLEADCERADG